MNSTGDYYTMNKDSTPNYDLGAMIACALSSNLYLNGLSDSEYVNLSSNLKPIDDWFKKANVEHTETAEDILARV